MDLLLCFKCRINRSFQSVIHLLFMICLLFLFLFKMKHIVSPIMIKSDAGMQLKLTLQLLPLVRLNSALQVSLCKQLCHKKRNHVVFCENSLSTLKICSCLLIINSINHCTVDSENEWCNPHCWWQAIVLSKIRRKFCFLASIFNWEHSDIFYADMTLHCNNNLRIMICRCSLLC